MPRKKKIESVEPVVTTDKKKRVRHSYVYAVGRRKTAVARTRLFKNGSGKITVNEREFTNYFQTFDLQQIVKKPLEVISKVNDFDFSIRVQGGGIHGQAQAVAHGIARVLFKLDPDLKPLLKVEKLLTRDSRRKERKKPGLKRARRAPQFSKR